ncbi:Zinc finger C-x8-C-x5-C-x3-H type family protein [Prunus dulcis]|uniref:Zinc finger C-x8-C-x5-C-x3-H type family protein n=1 Tax=Prunus dulcis TaxID=3755 RepID=A0A4Y1S231_PRUDU|nr:Zinc finger C-x8-C-x5-C-x3-H type family protein [Prunus dulcis]
MWEQMWQLGLTSSESYPERPGVPNCVYYMRTGFCGYGIRCRYNHPRDRAAVVAAVRATGDYPERVENLYVSMKCNYYLKTGTCKFGASCKFHHPKHGGGSLSRAPLNIYGLPLRPGENECSYYLKTGQCKFGITCKFHHPQPAGTTIPASAPQFYPSVQSPSVPMAEQFGGHPPAPLSPVLSPGAQPTIGATSLYGVTQLSSPTHGLARPYTSYPLLLVLLAAARGVQPCTFYLQNGHCKFGSTCKFDHPIGTMRYNPSASSLVDMPVTPYPVGSLLATLAPSSSSTDLRPELISTSKKDTYSTRVPSSGTPQAVQLD